MSVHEPCRTSLQRPAAVLASVAVLAMVASACDADTPATSTTPSSTSHGVPLADAVATINQEVMAKGYSLHTLTVDEFQAWFDEAKLYELLRGERDSVSASIDEGFLPRTPDTSPSPTSESSGDCLWPDCDKEPTIIGSPGYGFELSQDPGSGKSAEILVTPFYVPIVREAGYLPYTSYLRELLSPDLDLSSEPFKGPPPAQGAALDPSVQVRVSPIEVQGEPKSLPAETDALKVEIRVSPDSLDAAADYFGSGFGKEQTRRRLADLLGTAPEVWVDLKDVIPNWVGERTNTFPRGRDTDVCHGAAREFYYPEQDERHNASTEASNLLLEDHYCLMGEDVTPVFGDYLNVPNLHSGRYILRDPASGRDISFSVQSGGNAPYRFYWLDEDFSAKPFGHVADPDVLTTRVDVWRRCR